MLHCACCCAARLAQLRPALDGVPCGKLADTHSKQTSTLYAHSAPEKDMALVWDRKFKQTVDVYAKDEDK